MKKSTKRILAGLAAFLIIASIVLTFSGCAVNKTETVATEENPSMFVEVERAGSWRVVYHKDTKVMYAVSFGAYNLGTFTLLVNADGTPMLWEGLE